MTGTTNQIEWAEQIKPRVNAEFDRVEKAFQSVARRQGEPERQDTLRVIAILEEKRGEVMANGSAGYFIHGWRELTDQVRRLISDDPRFAAIKSGRKTRTPSALRNRE